MSRAICERCQGNGELVTDWGRYLGPHDGDAGDEAVAECHHCDGQGFVQQNGCPSLPRAAAASPPSQLHPHEHTQPNGLGRGENEMTKDELDDFLEANRAEIAAAVKAKLIEGLLTQHRWEMSEIVAKTVNEFVTTEVVPEIKAYLEGEKGVIIASAKEAARQIGELITTQMVTTAAKNISGYNFRKTMEAVFSP